MSKKWDRLQSVSPSLGRRRKQSESLQARAKPLSVCALLSTFNLFTLRNEGSAAEGPPVNLFTI